MALCIVVYLDISKPEAGDKDFGFSTPKEPEFAAALKPYITRFRV